jgi:hypothetical protein
MWRNVLKTPFIVSLCQLKRLHCVVIYVMTPCPTERRNRVAISLTGGLLLSVMRASNLDGLAKEPYR